MDHGSQSEDAVSRPGPLFDPLLALDHPAAFDDPSAHEVIPVNPYAAANLHAFSANAHPVAADPSSSDDPSDPADFYRNYRDEQTANVPSATLDDPMAPAVTSSTRQPPPLQPNGTGTATKRLPVPASRNAPRSSRRSVSSPVDGRLGSTESPGGKPTQSSGAGRKTSGPIPPSVKDLKKRFDQPGSQPISPDQKPASRSASRDGPSSGINGKTSAVGTGATSYGTSRPTGTRDAGREGGRGSSMRGAQRPKYAVGDQGSGSSQSFASRISRPASKPAAHPSSNVNSRTGPPRQNGLLFGEILPEQSDSGTPGFGIERVRPRRTSESSISNPARLQTSTLSDPDMEAPSSPTDWYRSAALHGQQDPDHHTSRLPKGHSRAHSDLAGSKLALIRPDYGAVRNDASSSISPSSPASATSRLPRLVKKKNDTSSHASPVSSRSTSPSTLRYSGASGRTSRQHVSSASRARTPTSASSPKTKTPSQIPSSTRKSPPSNVSTQASSRLNAYVAAPPPKLSPSLRSSRPRQSVATAATAASRMRAAERSASPLRQSQRPPSKPDEPTPRRRKPSVGAIDFAQRRESIKLAYSKSVRDSQAREARRAAAEKRKKELAAAARAKVEAEAATTAALAHAAAAAAAAAVLPPSRKASGDARHSEPTDKDEDPAKEAPAETVIDLSTPGPTIEEPHGPSEPLRLEIPGSFPHDASPPLHQDDIPLSAISVGTAITEFDPEAQTEPPRQESSLAVNDASRTIAATTAPAPTEQQFPERSISPIIRKRASYQSPFDDGDQDDESASIKISLDTSGIHPRPPSILTPTGPDVELEAEPEPIPPPAEDDEYVPRPYTYSSENYGTTVTILGPENDFQPLHKEPPRATISGAVLPQADELPVTGAPETVVSEAPHQADAAYSEQPQVEIEHLARLEDFYIAPTLRDNVATLRDSTFTSSDLSTSLDDHTDRQKAPEASHSLTVPGLLAPGNRLSQHSAWTDFSFGSEDPDPRRPDFTAHAQELDAQARRVRIIPSTGDLSTCASSLGDLTRSPEVSSLDRPDSSSPPMLPELPTSALHLSDLGAAESFPARSDSESGRGASLPEHSPPEPPSSGNHCERDNSTLYLAESRPESFAYSYDGKDETATPPDTAPHQHLDSTGHSRVSLDETLCEKHVPLTEEEQKEQKRLRQRQMVVQELIDTEDAFVRDMTVVEEIYKGTAEACPNLDSKTIKLIFRNTDEIIAFHAALLVEFKEGAASVYTPKGRRSPLPAPDAKDADSTTQNSVHSSARPDRDDEKDRLSSLGPVFSRNIEQLKAIHEVYLRSSDQSSKRLIQIQEDKTVMLWLDECNEVAKELTTAWNLDSLLIKPMQRITKYPDIITHLLKYTPEDHPDREPLIKARAAVVEAIDEINKTKKNFELVGQIVSNRKRKESDVRAGLARAFGKRVDKLQVSNVKTAEDEDYLKLQQQFGDDYLRLQVVLRDVEYYTRTVATYVREFLQYLSSIELVMRLQPSRDYAHLESKWVQFNVSMRDMEKIALERHLADVRKHVIEPFEHVIRCYGNPSLAMKKRAKRRLDYEKYVQLKANGKKVDKQLAELVEQYEALNDTLKKELPKLSAMTAKIGNICLGKFISIQATWFSIWKEKVKMPLPDPTHVPELSEIVSTFHREFALQEERAMALGILNPTLKSRASQSTTDDASSILSKGRSRPSDIASPRGRGLSINSDYVPSLPTPEFAKRHSGQFSISPASSALPSPANYYRDYYSGTNGHGRGAGSASPAASADPGNSSSNGFSRSTAALPSTRPSTGVSFDSASFPRQSTESTATTHNRRDSNSTFNSAYNSSYIGGYPAIGGGGGGGPPSIPGSLQQQDTAGSASGSTRRLSGLFHSALPLPDGPEEMSQRSSRASSRERGPAAGGYKVLWLAASLFEFNIETTKHEAGYPYLTYQAGEIFDVIAEKGELWLAKNQDDPRETVGWIWSKHFAKLADS